VVGGEWPQRVAQAIRALTPQELDDEAAGVLLLEDFYHLFKTKQTDRLTSEAVVAALRQLEERPWSERGRNEKPITATQVARLLRPFDIKPKSIRVGTGTPKGYEREQFTDAWARYLPLLSVTHSPPPEAQPSATAPHISNDAPWWARAAATTSNGAPVADADGRNPALQADCGGVAEHHQHPVAARTPRNPASNQDCGGVADQTPAGAGSGVKVGDWVLSRSAEGSMIPDSEVPPPYLICKIERGTDGALYA
jgi:hypothetical protein